jgi:hypothetical protein
VPEALHAFVVATSMLASSLAKHMQTIYTQTSHPTLLPLLTGHCAGVFCQHFNNELVKATAHHLRANKRLIALPAKLLVAQAYEHRTCGKLIANMLHNCDVATAHASCKPATTRTAPVAFCTIIVQSLPQQYCLRCLKPTYQPLLQAQATQWSKRQNCTAHDKIALHVVCLHVLYHPHAH